MQSAAVRCTVTASLRTFFPITVIVLLLRPTERSRGVLSCSCHQICSTCQCYLAIELRSDLASACVLTLTSTSDWYDDLQRRQNLTQTDQRIKGVGRRLFGRCGWWHRCCRSHCLRAPCRGCATKWVGCRGGRAIHRRIRRLCRHSRRSSRRRMHPRSRRRCVRRAALVASGLPHARMHDLVKRICMADQVFSGDASSTNIPLGLGGAAVTGGTTGAKEGTWDAPAMGNMDGTPVAGAPYCAGNAEGPSGWLPLAFVDGAAKAGVGSSAKGLPVDAAGAGAGAGAAPDPSLPNALLPKALLPNALLPNALAVVAVVAVLPNAVLPKASLLVPNALLPNPCSCSPPGWMGPGGCSGNPSMDAWGRKGSCAAPGGGRGSFMSSERSSSMRLVGLVGVTAGVASDSGDTGALLATPLPAAWWWI